MRFGVHSGLWSLGLVFGLWSLVFGFTQVAGQLVGSIDSGLAGGGADDAAGSCSDKVGTANSIHYVALKSFLFPVWCWFQAFLS